MSKARSHLGVRFPVCTSPLCHLTSLHLSTGSGTCIQHSIVCCRLLSAYMVVVNVWRDTSPVRYPLAMLSCIGSNVVVSCTLPAPEPPGLATVTSLATHFHTDLHQLRSLSRAAGSDSTQPPLIYPRDLELIYTLHSLKRYPRNYRYRTDALLY